MARTHRTTYPFAALVGQHEVKLALTLAAIEPRIGGVLLTGEKGTAKSTAVRGLVEVTGAPFRTLPLGATEDRVAGGLDIEQSIAAGKPAFSTGLLADVDGGVLYVDEVNLLPDHLVDLVLDASASGVNHVEREGFSVTHPARFTLVGTMNPEEGEVRPQLLDRFGLCVRVRGETDPATRVELLRRRIAFDTDRDGFLAAWGRENEALGHRIEQAKMLLPEVLCDSAMKRRISDLAAAAYVAGLRADLVWTRAATAHAAWNRRDAVTADDIMAVAELVLSHRRRDTAPPQLQETRETGEATAQNSESDNADDARGTNTEGDQGADEHQDDEGSANVDSTDQDSAGRDSADRDSADQGNADGRPESDDGPSEQNDNNGDDGVARPSVGGPQDAEAGANDVADIGESFAVRDLTPVGDRGARATSGKRDRRRSPDRHGRYLRARPTDRADDLAVDATLRAAAPHQIARRARYQQDSGENPGRRVFVTRQDWHGKIREHHTSTCVVFLVDASGSMGAKGRMTITKGAIFSLLLDAYQQRDKVAMVTFRRDDANVVLPPTASVDVAARLLRDLATGGRTPLAHGLIATHELLQPVLHRDPTVRPLVVVLSDGRANVCLDGTKRGATQHAHDVAARVAAADKRVTWLVVDTEAEAKITLGLATPLAHALGAEVIKVDDLKARDLVDVAKDHKKSASPATT